MKRQRGVRVIGQRHDFDCGVAALAMYLAVPYGDVAAVCRTLWGSTKPAKRGLGLYHLEAIAAALGILLQRTYPRAGYLENASGVLGMNGGSMCWAGHWVVLKGGAVVDPDGGEVWTLKDYLKATGARPATLLTEV